VKGYFSRLLEKSHPKPASGFTMPAAWPEPARDVRPEPAMKERPVETARDAPPGDEKPAPGHDQGIPVHEAPSALQETTLPRLRQERKDIVADTARSEGRSRAREPGTEAAAPADASASPPGRKTAGDEPAITEIVRFTGAKAGLKAAGSKAAPARESTSAAGISTDVVAIPGDDVPVLLPERKPPVIRTERRPGVPSKEAAPVRVAGVPAADEGAGNVPPGTAEGREDIASRSAEREFPAPKAEKAAGRPPGQYELRDVLEWVARDSTDVAASAGAAAEESAARERTDIRPVVEAKPAGRDAGPGPGRAEAESVNVTIGTISLVVETAEAAGEKAPASREERETAGESRPEAPGASRLSRHYIRVG
jgi:hypothetical protein